MCGLIIGLVLIILLILFPYFSGTGSRFLGSDSQACPHNESLSFSVFNRDLNRSHVAIFLFTIHHARSWPKDLIIWLRVIHRMGSNNSFILLQPVT